MRFHAGLAALAAALALGAAPGLAADRALIVGVAEYRDATINDLTGPALDVVRMRRLLTGTLDFAPDEIKVLAEDEATRGNILAAIADWLIGGTEAGDRVFLYFSGHGAQVEIPDGAGGMRLTSGLVPYDASNGVPATETGAGGLILGSQLGELIRQMTGREVTIVVDACHSGSLTRGDGKPPVPAAIRTITPNGPVELDPSEVTDDLIAEAKTGVRLLDFNAKGGEPMPGVAVWSAATIAQYSWDTGEGGVFTNAFIGGLEEAEAAYSDAGRVTASSLLAHVREAAGAFCAATPDCTLGFTPELLAPEPYRVSVLVPHGAVPDEPATPPAEPEGPELIDVAEGVFAHSNDFALEASIEPGSGVRVNAGITPAAGVGVRLGDTVTFRIVSAEAGELVVMDTGPDGKLRRIFPNSYSEGAGRGGTIRAGAPLTIPDAGYGFEFTATDAGPGTLLVLVAEPGTDFSALLEDPAFEAMRGTVQAMVSVGTALQTPVLSPDPDEPNRARRWAFVTVPYTIVP